MKDDLLKFPSNGYKWKTLEDLYTVDPETGCWNWNLALGPTGYGYMNYCYKGENITRMAHRIMYTKLVGPIPDGLHIDHLCRNRRCVNPDHLEPVTSEVNSQRGSQAKITIEIAREIRSLEGTMSPRLLGERFGLATPTIRHILARRRWKESA